MLDTNKDLVARFYDLAIQKGASYAKLEYSAYFSYWTVSVADDTHTAEGRRYSDRDLMVVLEWGIARLERRPDAAVPY